jgi:hypothetical protein
MLRHSKNFFNEKNPIEKLFKLCLFEEKKIRKTFKNSGRPPNLEKSQNGQYCDKVSEQDLHVANQRKSFISDRRTER